MPRTKPIPTRSLTPFRPTPLFPSVGFPSLTRTIDELSARTNEMIRTAFAGFPDVPSAEWAPAVNVVENKDEFTVTAELPGLTADDVTIDYGDGVLTIKGEKEFEKEKEEKGEKYYVWERRFGSFERSLPFPGTIDEDKVAAAFKDGVLTVHLPKTEKAKAEHHSIPIEAK